MANFTFKFKRIVFAFLLVLTVASIYPAQTFAAANTTDTSFTKIAYTSNWNFAGERRKYNSTPVYVYYTSGTYSSVKCRVMGYTTDGLSWANVTRSNGNAASYVWLSKGTQHSIRSLCYENGWTYATPEFQSSSSTKNDTISGVWSPDSTKVYTVATA